MTTGWQILTILEVVVVRSSSLRIENLNMFAVHSPDAVGVLTQLIEPQSLISPFFSGWNSQFSWLQFIPDSIACCCDDLVSSGHSDEEGKVNVVERHPCRQIPASTD